MTTINQNSKLKYKLRAISRKTPKLIFYEIIVNLYEKKDGVVSEKGKYIGRELVFISAVAEKLARNKARALNTLSVFPNNVIVSPDYNTFKVTKHIALKDLKHRPLKEESKSRKDKIVTQNVEPVKKEKPKPKVKPEEPKIKEPVLSKVEQEKWDKRKRFEELRAIAIESMRLHELSKVEPQQSS